MKGATLNPSQWLRVYGAIAAINAGMYERDLRSSSGHMRCGTHVNQGTWRTDYLSVLAFRPIDETLPPFTIVDLDQSGARETLEKYQCVVQNLRLIRAPGENVWQPTHRKWPEAAAALDRQGRLLLIFSPTPLSMNVFADRLLGSDLELVRAMHLDGGPPASLTVKVGPTIVDYPSSQEIVPNVLLVTPSESRTALRPE
jgi:hypothetical protein